MSNSENRRPLEEDRASEQHSEDNQRHVPESKTHYWALPVHFFWDSIGVYRTRHAPSTYRRKSQQEKSPEELVAQFTVVLALIGALGAIVNFLTFLVIRSQLGEMQSSSGQTDKIIAADTDLAKAASDQAVAIKTNTELSQRAWIGPFDAKIDSLEIGKVVNASVLYQNTGKRPANLNMLLFQVWYQDKDELKARKMVTANEEACAKVEAPSSGQVAFPIQTGSNYYLARIPSGSGDKPKYVVNQDVINGNTKIIVAGCFFYRSFEKSRHSYFAYVYDAKVSPDISHLSFYAATGFAD